MKMSAGKLKKSLFNLNLTARKRAIREEVAVKPNTGVAELAT